MIRPAQLTELDAMNAMIIRAKAHWGYDAEFMASVKRELTIGKGDLSPDLVVWADPDLRGMAQLSVAGETAQLEDLFVDPDAMGRGVGAALFRWAKEKAYAQGARVMKIDSDPFAEPFYLKMGAIRVGKVPSGSIAGRMLPLLDFALDGCEATPQI